MLKGNDECLANLDLEVFRLYQRLRKIYSPFQCHKPLRIWVPLEGVLVFKHGGLIENHFEPENMKAFFR
jgi:hypothetical protein